MEVDSKNDTLEGEALLLGDGGEDHDNQEFSSGDVELLLGDDDVNAFANESYETNDDSSETNSEQKPQETKSEIQHEHNNHFRGRGGRMRYVFKVEILISSIFTDCEISIARCQKLVKAHDVNNILCYMQLSFDEKFQSFEFEHF